MWRTANLAGFIARYAGLAALKDASTFRRAAVIDWGAAVGWPGSLDIGSRTLIRLSDEQQAFSNAESRTWQAQVALTNPEAASVLGVSLATVKNYRYSAEIPAAIAIACRTMQSDPAVLAAHYAPSQGKVRKAAA